MIVPRGRRWASTTTIGTTWAEKVKRSIEPLAPLFAALHGAGGDQNRYFLHEAYFNGVYNNRIVVDMKNAARIVLGPYAELLDLAEPVRVTLNGPTSDCFGLARRLARLAAFKRKAHLPKPSQRSIPAVAERLERVATHSE